MNVSNGRNKPLDEHAAGHRVWLGALTVLVAMVATVALALYQFVPPAVVSADAPAKEFSAERAMAHLEVIARKPHPVGSPENARVRDYLIQEISAMGLRPQVQKTTVFESVPDEADATTVKNILVRIEGKAPTNRAVLITAHYDSVVTGPGAGDNGMSVATMLETLRAVRAGPPSRNDLIFLFNDGEEAGLIGSTAFVEQHPWAKDVGVVFDFDRSDGRGVAILSWTAAHDGWLVQEIANALPGTVATSADNDSERQDYDNDLHAFAAAGFTGAHWGAPGARFWTATSPAQIPGPSRRRETPWSRLCAALGAYLSARRKPKTRSSSPSLGDESCTIRLRGRSPWRCSPASGP